MQDNITAVILMLFILLKTST